MAKGVKSALERLDAAIAGLEDALEERDSKIAAKYEELDEALREERGVTQLVANKLDSTIHRLESLLGED